MIASRSFTSGHVPGRRAPGLSPLQCLTLAGAGVAVLLLAVTLVIGSAHAAENLQDRDGIAVIIGNSDYGDHITAAPFAVNDARAMARFAEGILGIAPERVVVMEDAGQSELFAMFGNRVSHRGRLHRLAQETDGDVFVFYSGHGVPGPSDDRAYLLPVDGDPDTPEITGYGVDVLFHNLAKLDARSVTVFLDAGFTGSTPAGRLTTTSRETPVTAVPFGLPDGISVLTASRPGQMARWHEDQRHGLFTEYLLRGLYGSADVWDFGNGDGEVSLAELKRYLDVEMSPVARGRFGGEQEVDVSGTTDVVLASLDLDNPPLRPLVATQDVAEAPINAVPDDAAARAEAEADAAQEREIARLREELEDVRRELAEQEEARQADAETARLEEEAARDEAREEEIARLEEALEDAESELDRFMADPRELSLWQEVRDSGNPEDLKVYILSYPDGRYVDIAKIRLAKMTRMLIERRVGQSSGSWQRDPGWRPAPRPDRRNEWRPQRFDGPPPRHHRPPPPRPNWF